MRISLFNVTEIWGNGIGSESRYAVATSVRAWKRGVPQIFRVGDPVPLLYECDITFKKVKEWA
jgi:hypothetical protein